MLTHTHIRHIKVLCVFAHIYSKKSHT